MNCVYKGVWLTDPHRVLGMDWSYLTILGLIGTITFSMRFIIQWLASERAGKSVIPTNFWYWSIGGSLIMLFYFTFQRDPVGVLAYLPNSAIYLRNLYLTRKNERKRMGAA